MNCLKLIRNYISKIKKRNWRFHFAILNEELKILKCVKVVEQVWNVKISRSELNATMIGIILIILDPIADPCSWFETSKQEN